MYVQCIKLANGEDCIKKKDSGVSCPIKCSSNLNSAKVGKDSISFGGLDPATIALIKMIGSGIGAMNTNYVISKAEKLLLSQSGTDVISGLEVAIAMTDKIGTKVVRHLTNYEDFLGTASQNAQRLSDNTFAEKDIKQRFLRSVFLRKTKDDETTFAFDTFYADKIPSQAKRLFKNMSNDIYGEFKKDLVKKSVVDNKILIDDPYTLLEGNYLEGSYKASLDEVLKNLSNDKRYSQRTYQQKCRDNPFGHCR